MSMRSSWDVAVIGAGAAGLTAARILAEAGKSVLLLEASDRVGGRVRSLASSESRAYIELGAEFVHGEPEPTLALAREAGVELIELSDRHFLKHGQAFVESSDPWRPFTRVLKLLGPNEPDTSARAFVERHGIDPETTERFRQLVEGFEAAPLAEVGIRSLATDSDALASEERQFRVRGGYGQLMTHVHDAALAAGVQLRMRSPVLKVGWRNNGPVSLELEGSSLHAQRCIVAVPLSILQAEPRSGGIAFDPPVAAWAGALGRFGMGHACRIVFEFRGTFTTHDLPPAAFIHNPITLFETFWSQETATHTLWTAWAGGPKAAELAKESAAQREKLALGALAALFDEPESTLAQRLAGVHHHDFSNDPYVRGAYSFRRPDDAGAGEALSVPCATALFLAGEVTDHRYPGTVAGAIASGQRAARQVLEAMSNG